MTEIAAQLAALEAAARPEFRTWSQASYDTALTQTGAVFIGDATGFALGRVVLDTCELYMLVTAPAYQGRGLGQQNLQAFLQKIQCTGARTCFLDVAEDNLPAISLYQKLSFACIDRRKAYFRTQNGAKRDALIFQKAL